MIEILICVILVLLFLYLLVGGCLWFTARYKIIFHVIKKQGYGDEWSRLPGGGCGLAGFYDDYLGEGLQEAEEPSSMGMIQVPGIFSRRIQKR